MTTGYFDAWTIYEKPDDYPAYWVVRRYHIGVSPDPVPRGVALFDSLEAARKSIPIQSLGLVRMERSPSDVRSLRETWM